MHYSIFNFICTNSILFAWFNFIDIRNQHHNILLNTHILLDELKLKWFQCEGFYLFETGY